MKVQLRLREWEVVGQYRLMSLGSSGAGLGSMPFFFPSRRFPEPVKACGEKQQGINWCGQVLLDQGNIWFQIIWVHCSNDNHYSTYSETHVHLIVTGIRLLFLQQNDKHEY